MVVLSRMLDEDGNDPMEVSEPDSATAGTRAGTFLSLLPEPKCDFGAHTIRPAMIQKQDAPQFT